MRAQINLQGKHCSMGCPLPFAVAVLFYLEGDQERLKSMRISIWHEITVQDFETIKGSFDSLAEGDLAVSRTGGHELVKRSSGLLPDLKIRAHIGNQSCILNGCQIYIITV